MNESARREQRIEGTLFLVSLFTYAYFYQAADQSIAARFDLIRSILERRTLWIDGFCGYNTADIISVGGHYYSVKAPGTSLTGLLPWSLVTWFLSPIFQRNEFLGWALATYLATVLTISVLIATLTVVMYRLGKALGASPARSAAVALIMAFATILFPYATEMTGEPVAAFCLMTSFYLMVTFANAPAWDRALGAGALAGWAVLNDFPSLLVAAALGFYALAKLPKWRHVISFSAGAAAAGAILMLYNWGAFQHPFFMSYQAYKMAGNTQFPEQAVGFVGLTYPRLKILWDILVDPQRGLLFCNPVLILAVPGLVYFWRSGRRAEFFVTIEAIAAFIVFNASFGESIISWGGGTATGPRQLAPMIPFMALTLLFLPASIDYLTAALAGLSALYMLAATSTNPHFPYEYDNPVWQFALPHYFHGDLSFNRDTFFAGPAIIGDSVAFNLGKLAGLPGSVQLVPLALAWIIAAAELLEDFQMWPDDVRASLGAGAVSLGIVMLFLPPLCGNLRRQLSLDRRHGLLARYYVGEQAGATPAHLVRVDPMISFDNVAELGAMPFPSTVIWTGTLMAPRTGLYRFTIQADDTGWITIDGKTLIADSGNVMRMQQTALTQLNAGPHRILVGERNFAGDASAHLYWQFPGGAQELVPSSALIPDRFLPGAD